MKNTKEKIGLIILIVMLGTNLIVAAMFYNLDSKPIPDFFYQQAQKNVLFDPRIRY